MLLRLACCRTLTNASSGKTYSWHLKAWSGSSKTVLLQQGEAKVTCHVRLCGIIPQSIALPPQFGLPKLLAVANAITALMGCTASTGSFFQRKLGQCCLILFRRPLLPLLWHLGVLRCSSERSAITPVHLPGHCSGRLPLSTASILSRAVAAGYPCLFNFPPFCTTNSGIYHVQQTPSASLAMQKAPSVRAVVSHMRAVCLSTIQVFPLALPFPHCFFAVILETFLGCFRWVIYSALTPLDPTLFYSSFHPVLLTGAVHLSIINPILKTEIHKR